MATMSCMISRSMNRHFTCFLIIAIKNTCVRNSNTSFMDPSIGPPVININATTKCTYFTVFPRSFSCENETKHERSVTKILSRRSVKQHWLQGALASFMASALKSPHQLLFNSRASSSWNGNNLSLNLRVGFLTEATLILYNYFANYNIQSVHLFTQLCLDARL